MKIIKLSELSPEMRLQVEQEIASMNLPEPYAEFDEFGLKFPVQHLMEIGYYLAIAPLEYQARYADVVCVYMVDNDPEELKKNVDANQWRTDADYFETVNATAIGNAAYIALNAKDEAIRTRVFDWLSNLMEWVINEKIGITDITDQEAEN